MLSPFLSFRVFCTFFRISPSLYLCVSFFNLALLFRECRWSSRAMGYRYSVNVGNTSANAERTKTREIYIHFVYLSSHLAPYSTSCFYFPWFSLRSYVRRSIYHRFRRSTSFFHSFVRSILKFNSLVEEYNFFVIVTIINISLAGSWFILNWWTDFRTSSLAICWVFFCKLTFAPVPPQARKPVLCRATETIHNLFYLPQMY